MPAAKAQKYSRQRESILDYLHHTTSHPTADTVYHQVRQTYPKISLGTVYRNLNLLADQGIILRLNCGDGCERFDGNADEHYHFICRSCHRVYDLTMPSIEHINTLAATSFHGRVDGHKAYFYGVCGECEEKQ